MNGHGGVAFKIDATVPVLSGLPASCEVWPPNNKMVQVAAVAASDALSGLAGAATVEVQSNEAVDAADVQVSGGIVNVRAFRLGTGDGRRYEIRAEAVDLAGNTTTGVATCVVPRDQGAR